MIANAGVIISEPTMYLEVITLSDRVNSAICDLITRRSQILLQTIDGINVSALFKIRQPSNFIKSSRYVLDKVRVLFHLGSIAAEVRKV
ncbi:MAG: hypothetical protein ACTS4Z_00095 [Candidatus Hodgkinia cicadicola]